ncbi:MAG: DUF3828 domain-containing protein [Serratia proteamaculans]|jgi:ABC-type transporter MlaC component
MKIISLLTAFLFITSLGSVNAADVNCASPKKITSDFYHWYLQEINQNKYPLTSSAANDKNRLKKWVSPELLNKLGESLSENDLDAEYFTDAQDIFDDWVNNISTHQVEQTEHKVDVKLQLGVSEIKKTYDVSLDDNHGCWKINNVASE